VKPTKKRGRYQPADILEAIAGYARLKSPTRIKEMLGADPQFQGRKLPATKTIGRILKDLPEEEGKELRLASRSAADASLLLPVLRALIENTDGAVTTLTEKESARVLWLRRIAPGLDPWSAYRLARFYMARDAQKEKTEDLDIFLAFEPWRSPEEYRLFEKWVREHRPQWVGGRTTLVPLKGGPDISVPVAEGMWLAIDAWAQHTAEAVFDMTVQEIIEGRAPRAGAADRFIARFRDLLSRTILVDTHTDNAEGAGDSAAEGQTEG
jgi:hypothetical protein